MRFSLLLLLALVCVLPATAQRTIIETDRPGQVPSPYTVPQGVLQAELGALNGLYTEDSGNTSTVFNFPLSLRFGLTDGIEARVSSNVYQFNSVENAAGVKMNSDGFADIVAGIKYTIPAGTRVNVVVIPEVIIPVAEDQGRDPRLHTNEVGFRGNFVARFDLGASPLELSTLIGTDVLKQFATTGTGTKYYAYANLAARLAGDLNEKAKLFGEIGVYPQIIDFNNRYAVVSAGAKILAADNVSFDVFGGRAFAKSAPYDWTFGLGVSTRF